MNSKSFTEKARKLSELVMLGIDISEFRDMDQVYESDSSYQYDYTIEGEMLREIREGMEGSRCEVLFERLSQLVGTARVEGIKKALLERIGYYERHSIERYEENEETVKKYEEQLEMGSESKEGQLDIVTNIRNVGDENQRERSTLMKNIEEDLYDATQRLEQLSQDRSISFMVNDVLDKYRKKALQIGDGIFNELENLEQEIEEMKQAQGKEVGVVSPRIQTDPSVVAFCQELGKDSVSLAQDISIRYTSGIFDVPEYEHISLGPKELEVNVARIDYPTYFDGKDKSVFISEKIIKDAEYGQKELFQDSQYRFYKNEKPEVIEYTVLTDDEGKRLEMRSQQLKQCRIFAQDKEKEDKHKKQQEYNIPEIFG